MNIINAKVEEVGKFSGFEVMSRFIFNKEVVGRVLPNKHKTKKICRWENKIFISIKF